MCHGHDTFFAANTMFLGDFNPVLCFFLAEITFNNKICFIFQENHDIIPAVVSRIKPEKQRLVCQLFCGLQGFPDKIRCSVSPVYASFAHLNIQTIAFLPDVSEHGGVTVTAFIGSFHAFPFLLGIVKGGDIQVNRDICLVFGVNRADFSICPADEIQ